MIVALTGPAGCGKTTAAVHLAEFHGFARVRFAAPLKAMVRAFLAEVGTEPAEIERMVEGDRKERPAPEFADASPRRFMQDLGTGFGRDLIHPELWTRAWRAGARSALARGAPGVVVEDCRFENEADAVRRLRGIIVRIERPGLVPIAGGHISEAGIREQDWRIRNDGPPEILHARLDGIIRRIMAA